MKKYISTRNKENIVDPHIAVIEGLAKDGGLFVPDSIDFKLEKEMLLNKSYQDIATTVLSAFLPDYTKEELSTCVHNAYDENFDCEAVVPVTKLSDCHLMELYHGPTCAFKDVALTILPHLLTTAYEKEDRHDTISILTATSGDTGKAALSGFKDVPHTAVTVFYPEIGVSFIQKRQMQTSKGDNVKVIAVQGNFDDCQRMVKQASVSDSLQNYAKNVTISSANSINIGRLVPQIVYYCSTYARLVENNEIPYGEEINFVVPTGNFGDILAGYLAKQIGLPIHKLICASNSNHVLTDFLETGTYSIDRQFETTISPSMDILISSNLERLLFLASKQDDVLVSNLMNELKESGSYTIPSSLLETIRNDFAGEWVDEDTCKKAIHDLYENEKFLMDPHTSVGYAAYHAYQNKTGDTTKSVILSTASPYKFAASVYESLTSEKIEEDFDSLQKLSALTNTTVPSSLAELSSLPVRFTQVISLEEGLTTIQQRLLEISNAHN